MAALEKRVDLTKIEEFRYLPKRHEMYDVCQSIIGELMDGSVHLEHEIYSLLSTNNYREFDAYIRGNPGKRNFIRILQQILLYEYFTEKPLTRKQIQNALGIQQACWAVDDDNCSKQIKDPHYNYTVLTTELVIWEEIDPGVRELIVNGLYEEIRERLYEDNKKRIHDSLSETLWYTVTTDPPKSTERGWFPYPQNDSDIKYFPLPETLRNLTLISCIYIPVILFGTLSSPTLTFYMMKHKKRPYTGHLPIGTNLCSVHASAHTIFEIWRHDFHHSKTGSCRIGFKELNRELQAIFPGSPSITNEADLQSELDNPESALNKFIKMVKEDERENHAKIRFYHNYFSNVNDSGMLWTENPIPSFGGTKRMKRKKRKSKKH